jgi:phosphatidylglycerophosphatase A
LQPCYDLAMQRLAYHIATVLGLGDRLPAPGTTAGSLPAVVGWWLAMQWLPDAASGLAATLGGSVVALAVGVWAAGAEERRRGAGDPGPVVVDEVAGQWLTLIPATLLLDGPRWPGLALAAAAGFVLFRFFDVAKPWPVRRFEALPGGLGIMTDDVAAAAYAAACLAIALHWLG